MKLKYFFEKNYNTTTDKHYIHILRNLNELINKFPIEDIKEEDIIKIISLDMFILSKIKSKEFQELCFNEIPHKDMSKKIMGVSLKFIENPDLLSKFNNSLSELGLETLKLNEIQKNFLPRITANAYEKADVSFQKEYLKKLMDKFNKAIYDKKVLTIFLIMSEVAKHTNNQLKKLICSEISKIDENAQRRFKRVCIKDIKKICCN